jgi:hypothetical protein
MADASGELVERRREAQHGRHWQSGHDRAIAIIEAVMLSMVALMAAWSGYCAATWDTEASNLLAHSSAVQVEAQAVNQEALQIQTLDSVAFDGALSAYLSRDLKAFNLTIHQMRPGYRRAFNAWVALHPLKNPSAPRNPSLMPQYRLPQEARGKQLTAEAHALYVEAGQAGRNSDHYVRLTVILATVLFLLGISGHFPVRSARYGLIGVGTILIIYSVVQMLGLPGPPA